MKKIRFLSVLVCVCALSMAFFALGGCEQLGGEDSAVLHTHSWVNATCVNPKTCSDCGETQGQPLGHNEVEDKAVTPTCTEDGLTAGKHCVVCEEVLIAQEILPAIGHKTVKDSAISPDCVNTGLTEGSHCLRCGEVFVAQEVVDALGHSWEDPDCNQPKTCSECGATEGEPLDHIFVNNSCESCGKNLSDYFNFTLLENDTYSVKIKNAEDIRWQVIIPSVYENKPVTCIGEMGLYNCKKMSSLVIPHSIISIGYAAFEGCDSLENIEVEENNLTYKTVDGNLYNKNGDTLVLYALGKRQKTFEIPNFVTSIGDYAFADCVNLEQIKIPNSVTSIGIHAFSCCVLLKEIEIPNSVNTIKRAAFANCDSLISVVIPDSVTVLEGAIFFECDSLTSVKLSNAIEVIQSITFYCCNSLTSVIIPDSVKLISSNAFSECTALKEIKLPTGLFNIQKYAFFGCTALTSIVIPKSVLIMGESVFSNCNSLTIYCEASKALGSWNENWNPSNCPVNWNFVQ